MFLEFANAHRTPRATFEFSNIDDSSLRYQIREVSASGLVTTSCPWNWPYGDGRTQAVPALARRELYSRALPWL